MGDFNLSLNEDQEQIKSWIHDFAVDVIRPAAEEWDEREEFPWPIVQEAAKIGLYGMDFMANGIADPTGLTLPVAIEEMFWGDAGIGLSIFGSGLAAAAISANGTFEQLVEWVPQCYGDADKVQLGALCASEPDAGSDVGGYRTRAVYDQAKDEWVLNGTKAWITNGGIADVHVVVAVVEPGIGSRGHASFVVPPGTPGLSMGQKYKKHGIRASHTSEVVLDDVRIPGSCLLGSKERLDAKIARAKENQSTGEKQPAMATFEATRPTVGAMAVGIARAAYEYALEYAKERKAFGEPIIMKQGIAFKLADMATEIDASRLLVWRAAWMASAKVPFVQGEGSMSKLKASEVAVRATEDAIQILGGYGYTREYPVERWHRDSKIMTIFEGTSEIQRLVIARSASGVRVP
ncbi:MAG TPA: acyl-CoA dehydrogenase family protein [Microthrixaceae bacterium]|nr:acyl-CoA dehydrogenase family protein [Microthrixaceae bacterium]HMT60200.1 acyl-CoA dehydrogenase family protein [Microthrixaceae bacterium]